jgi:alpha-1,2-mannosyltransferase
VIQGVLARLLAQARSGAWLDGARARDYGVALGTLYFAACLGLVLWSGAAGLGNLDFTSFYAAGRLALTDPASVYDLAAHYAMQKAVTGNPALAYNYFFYPPVFLLVCAPLATLPYWGAYTLWGALQFCVYALALRTVVGRGATIAPYLAFPAGLLALVMGQNAMLTAALFAGATAAVAARREILAGILFGLLCYKPHFGLLVPVALVAGRYWRATAAAAVTVAGLVLVSAAIFGASVWLAYVSSFLHATAGVYGATHAGATSTGSTVPAWWLISPYGVALSFGLARSTALAVQAVAALAAAAAVAVIWRRRESGPGSRAMVLLAGTMLSAPVILYYDSLPVAVCLAWAAVEARRTGWLPWEKSFFLAAFVVALVEGLLHDLVHTPALLMVTLGVMVLAWRRAGLACSPATAAPRQQALPG